MACSKTICRRMPLLLCLFVLCGVQLVVSFQDSWTVDQQSSGTGPVHTKTFLSEPFKLGLGGVHKKFYQMFDMPEGHVALRSLTAEIVDDTGASVPLNEVYLHHWIVGRIFVEPKLLTSLSEEVEVGVAEPRSEKTGQRVLHNVETAARGEDLFAHRGLEGTSQTCEPLSLGAWFGVGAETRRTVYEFPAPYGVEVGNKEKEPAGKQGVWISQIHALDTRGAVNAKACIECRCDAYNTTKDEKGRPLPEGYAGGLLCCYEGVQCQVADNYRGPMRTLYARYTVKWVEMNPCVVPLRIYDLDATSCKVEYAIDSCQEGGSLSSCVDIRQRKIRFPVGGKLVYAVGHQHVGGLGLSIKGEDGRMLCNSVPLYGSGDQPGDEAGYVVGMEPCTSGGLSIKANETVTITSTYSKLGGGHTGVMGLFYMTVAVEEDYSPPPSGLCIGTYKPTLSANGLASSKVREDEVWQVSMWGATGGFLVGILVAGAIGGLALLLMWQHQDLAYAPISDV